MAPLVSFHAHPDDESIATGGVLAKAAAEGHRVVLVFATKGEHGEVEDGYLMPGETPWPPSSPRRTPRSSPCTTTTACTATPTTSTCTAWACGPGSWPGPHGCSRPRSTATRCAAEPRRPAPPG